MRINCVQLMIIVQNIQQANFSLLSLHITDLLHIPLLFFIPLFFSPAVHNIILPRPPSVRLSDFVQLYYTSGIHYQLPRNVLYRRGS